MPNHGQRPSERLVWPNAIDRLERDLLTFAVSWLPYRGTPEGEMLIHFGLSSEKFPDRLRDKVIHQFQHIHPRTAQRLLELCDLMCGDTAPVRTDAVRTPRVRRRADAVSAPTPSPHPSPSPTSPRSRTLYLLSEAESDPNRLRTADEVEFPGCAKVSFHRPGGCDTRLQPRLSELRPRGETINHRHISEVVVYIVHSVGHTIVSWDAIATQRIDWQEGDVFSFPVGMWHRHFQRQRDRTLPRHPGSPRRRVVRRRHIQRSPGTS